MTKLKIKLSPDYPLEWGPPAYATEGAACFDLRALSDDSFPVPVIMGGGMSVMVGPDGGFDTFPFRTGVSVEVPPGYVLLIFSRSGHGFKDGLRLSNCVGVIDSDYRGEILVKLQKEFCANKTVINHGDRIAQALLLPIPKVEIEIAEELSETVRGSGGFGSTGVA